MNTDDERDFELPTTSPTKPPPSSSVASMKSRVASKIATSHRSVATTHNTPTTMNSCRCGTKIRPSHPPVRNAKYMHHQKPPPAPVKRVSLAPLTRGALRNAAQRCGLSKRLTGPHVLRHTLATQLVRNGASFKEIADVLRHRSLDTTTIYAKVDLEALTGVAVPWPGSPT